MTIEQRPLIAKSTYRRMFGIVLAFLIALIYYGISKGVLQSMLPGVPLFSPPFGLWGMILTGIILGTIAGLLCSWTDASATGIILSSIFLAFMFLAINILTISNPNTSRANAAFVSFLFVLPFAGLVAIGALLFRMLVNYQTDRRKYLLGKPAQLIMPLIVLIGVGLVGWLSIMPAQGRAVLSRMHTLLQDPSRPVQNYIKDSNQPEYLSRVDMTYELEWEPRYLDRFDLYVPESAMRTASAAVVHYEDGWNLVCVFPEPELEPGCKGFEIMPDIR